MDFTPLLDITLILLFFFILFGNLDIEQMKADLEVQQKEARIVIEENTNLNLQLQEDLEFIEEYNQNQASLIRAMFDYRHGMNLKITLLGDNTSLIVRIYRGNDLLSEISPTENIHQILEEVLTEEGYTANDTIFCDFIFDASLSGTHKATKQIRTALNQIRQIYPSFYFSETDISIGAEK